MALEETRLTGLQALSRELGPVGLVRFLQQFETGRGDYTAEHVRWLGGRTVEEIADEIAARRKPAGDHP